MAGLIERASDQCFKAYIGVDETGAIVLHHRKLHPFIHPDIIPGDRFTVETIRGVRFGCLICYDNNLPENVRITTLMGAEVIVMPHVTGCTPSPMPGRGEVDPALLGQPRARSRTAAAGIPGSQGARVVDEVVTRPRVGERRLRCLQQRASVATAAPSSRGWR